MFSINKNHIKSSVNFSINLVLLFSFLLSQLSLAEIFLYQNSYNNNSSNIYNNIINSAQADTSDPWYNSSYSYRKEITIDHTKVSNTDQSNFPMLVSLTDTSLKTVLNGGKVQNNNGYDIIFTNQTGDIKLDHEIESYDPENGTIVMWVKIPTLSASTDTVIYIYYGNKNITTSQENITGVWDDNFKMVQHMSQNPAGIAPQMIDSTQYNNDGTSAGTMTSGDLVVGKIGGAVDFDGGDDYISVTDNDNLDLIEDMTVGFWIKNNDTFKSDIGASAQDYDNNHVPAVTYLDRTNPAPRTGSITNISVWINLLGGNNRIKIKTFKGLTWPTYQMTGESDFLTVSSTGLNTFSGLNIPVDQGDFIAIYLDGPRIDMQTSGGTGIHNVSGDVSGTVAFTSYSSGRRLALHGLIVSNNIIDKSAAYAVGFGSDNLHCFMDIQSMNIAVVSDDWTHIVWTYNRVSQKIYVNGFLVQSGDYSSDMSVNSANLLFGKYFTGSIDEVRISSTARSSDWIATEYNNQSSPSSFYTLSSEEEYMHHFIISGSSTQTAGNTQTLTITAIDLFGNTNTAYNGDKDITISGANTINSNIPTFTDKNGNKINFNSSGIITFTNGIATTDITLYKAETATIIVSDGSYSSIPLNIEVKSSGSSFIPPTKPNLSNLTITQQNNTLTFTNLPNNITQIAVSNTEDFSDSSFQDITLPIPTTSTLYLKFRTSQGATSDTIIYNPTSQNTNTLIQEGDIVKADSSFDVYIIKLKNNQQYKRLILSPSVFNSYQHLKWDNIKTISQEQINQYQTSDLVKVQNDNNIYKLTPNGDTGERKIIAAYINGILHAVQDDNTDGDDLNIDIDSIYEINEVDRESYEIK